MNRILLGTIFTAMLATSTVDLSAAARRQEGCSQVAHISTITPVSNHRFTMAPESKDIPTRLVNKPDWLPLIDDIITTLPFFRNITLCIATAEKFIQILFLLFVFRIQ